MTFRQKFGTMFIVRIVVYMYLKEIKASGFKSFADKITISLDDNITCIVGPNGSGKSNIVDAVRWVLGEQSVKNLRGANSMTDVIFSGSKSRSPLNMAYVSLVFDNTDHYLNVPYTEIVVTRKVYRSGENEYYLNQDKCRLKDIQDLFLDSGMGRYAFNIISQGEVGKIISDSPLDRRVIFEEAAGVLKYKKRKDEALRKLEKTNDNLVRVEDIIKELETQLTPLKEESAKAKEYLSIKEKLEKTEIALVANDLEVLNKSYQEQKQKIADLNTEILTCQTTNTNNDLSLESDKKAKEELSLKINNLQQELLSLTKEEERLNGEKNILKERSKYDKEDGRVLENALYLKEQRLKLKNSITAYETDLSILDGKITAMNDEISEERDAFISLKKDREELERSLEAKKREKVDISYRINYLQDYLENNQDVPSAVRKVLANPKLVVHDTIGHIINIDSNYLVALQVALGAAKDFVIVDNSQNAKECIEYLKEQKLGRVTFFPLDVIKPRYVDESTLTYLQEEPGFIDILASLVKADAKYRGIVYNQLGNVILVDNIDNANRISKAINHRYKIVTLAGEVLAVGGSITGGSLTTRTINNEKNELEQLKIKRNLVDNNITVLEKKLEGILKKEKQNQLDSIAKEKEKYLLSLERKQKQSLLDEVNKEYNEVTSEKADLDNLISGNISNALEQTMEDYYEVLSKKDKVVKNLEELKKEEDRFETVLEEKQASFRLMQSKIRNLENDLKQEEIKHTRTSVEMDHLLAILSGTYSITFEKAKANYTLEEDLDIARENVIIYKDRLKELGDVHVGAIEECERVTSRYDFLQGQSADLNKAISTLLGIIDELDEVMKSEFLKTFKQIEVEFEKVFKDLFGGGSAHLELTDKDNLLETGIDIIVMPPGKKVSTISLLSGGEKTLAAISLLFAILNIKNIPFCIFDEVEAALDEANVAKVGEYFKKYVNKTQLIIITHKKKTMEYADTLYGITMQESGVSKLVSVKLVGE